MKLMLSKKKEKEPSACFLPAHKSKSIKHWVKVRPDCTQDERKKLIVEYKSYIKDGKNTPVLSVSTDFI